MRGLKCKFLQLAGAFRDENRTMQGLCSAPCSSIPVNVLVIKQPIQRLRLLSVTVKSALHKDCGNPCILQETTLNEAWMHSSVCEKKLTKEPLRS